MRWTAIHLEEIISLLNYVLKIIMSLAVNKPILKSRLGCWEEVRKVFEKREGR
jgi:hypothetical protein